MLVPQTAGSNKNYISEIETIREGKGREGKGWGWRVIISTDKAKLQRAALESPGEKIAHHTSVNKQGF